MATCRILLVDDDLDDYRILQMAFADLGADESLSHVPNGLAALALLEEAWAKDGSVPDILVLDINMPAMNGPEVLKLIRKNERFSDIPAVIYSNSINPWDEAKCAELGVTYFITKPAKLDEIIQVGETLLALCHERDQLKEPGAA